MEPFFTPASVNPSLIKIASFAQLNAEFDFEGDSSTPPEQQPPPPRRQKKKTAVIKSDDYAVKIIQDADPDLANEISVGDKLNLLSQENLTHVFSFINGYVLSLDLPPGITELEPISIHKPGFGYINNPANHYVYLFMSKIDHDFSELPDEPKKNEDFFFEVLIGLFYARKKWKFCHYDLHEKNLMFNVTREPSSRSYLINGSYVTIEDTTIEPKLIDFGKSVIDVEYTDERWKEARFKKQWNKSDIYHLALIFSHRDNLSDKFNRFLKDEILLKYTEAMYAKKLENDSAANYKNIEILLKTYFGTNPIAKCMVCSQVAQFFVGESHQYFCSESCYHHEA